MAVAFWIVQCLLGLLFVITGSFKFFQNRDKVIASGGTWAEGFKPGTIKAIAATELISGLTLIVTKVTGTEGILALMAASCIGLIMIGSIYVHIRRKEFKHAVINTVFLLMVLFVVYALMP